MAVVLLCCHRLQILDPSQDQISKRCAFWEVYSIPLTWFSSVRGFHLLNLLLGTEAGKRMICDSFKCAVMCWEAVHSDKTLKKGVMAKNYDF
jgi:hypothetical protein